MSARCILDIKPVIFPPNSTWIPLSSSLFTVHCQEETRTVSQVKKMPPSSTNNYLPCMIRIILHAHPQVFKYTCVMFHQYRFICLGEVGLTMYMNRQGDSYIQSPRLLLRGLGGIQPETRVFIITDCNEYTLYLCFVTGNKATSKIVI